VVTKDVPDHALVYGNPAKVGDGSASAQSQSSSGPERRLARPVESGIERIGVV